MQYRTKHHLLTLVEARDYLCSTVIFRRCWRVSRTLAALVGIMPGGLLERSPLGKP